MNNNIEIINGMLKKGKLSKKQLGAGSKNNIIQLMLSTAGCFLKKHESPAPLLFESLLLQGNFTRKIVVLLSILLLCHFGRNEA